MRSHRKKRYRLLRLAAFAAAGMFALYLLRWTILESAVRSVLRELAAERLHADLQVDRFSGSILSSIVAHDVTLRLPGGQATIREVEARYGLFGLSSLCVDVTGARIVPIAAAEPSGSSVSASSSSGIRPVCAQVRSFRFPGLLRVHDSAVFWPQGEVILIDEVLLDPDVWRCRLSAKGVGAVAGTLTFRPGGAMTFDGRASEGPVPRVKIDLGSAEGSVHPVRFEATVQDHELLWAGRADFDDRGLPTRIVGEFSLPRGRAETVLECADGRLRADVDAVLPMWDGITLKGHAEGSLKEFAWNGSLLRGGIQADAAGVVRCAGSRPGFEADRFAVRGIPYVPLVAGSASVAWTKRGTWGVEVSCAAGEDSLILDGWIADATEFEGRFRAQGQCPWLDALGIPIPKTARPILISGTASGAGEAFHVACGVDAGSAFSAFPRMTVRHLDGSWLAEVAPGVLRLADFREIEYAPWRLELSPGRADFSGERLAVRDGQTSAGFRAAARWNAREATATFDAEDLKVMGSPVEPLSVRGRFERGSHDIQAEADWGTEVGNHLLVRARWGCERRIEMDLRLNDFRRPIFHDLLGGRPARGSVAANLWVAGREASGAIDIDGVAIGAWPPFTLKTPLRSEDGVLFLDVPPYDTPYGRLEGRGRLRFTDASLPVGLSVRLETDDFEFLRDRLPAGIPEGMLRTTVELHGPASAPEALIESRLISGAFRPSPGSGTLTDLRFSVRGGPEGLELGTLEGLMGGGPFRAYGRWDFWKKGSPPTLRMTGKDLLLVDREAARLRIDPDVTISYKGSEGLRAEGSIAAPLALIYERLRSSRSSAGKAGRGTTAPGWRLIPAPDGGFRIPGLEGYNFLVLDVDLTTTGECRFENGAFGALVEAETRLRGTLAEPTISGTLRSRHGEVKLGTGMFLQIESVEVLLPAEPGREPGIRFEGKVGKGRDAITVVLAGALEEPALTLSSETPRSQQELLAYLAFGRPPGTLTGTETLGTLASKAIEHTSSRWPQADPEEGFFDRFRLNVIPNEGAAAQRRLPWELPSADTSRGTVVRTEYELSPFFFLVVETDRETSLSGDTMLRFRFR